MFRQILFFVLVLSVSAALFEKRGDRESRFSKEKEREITSEERNADKSTQTDQERSSIEMIQNLAMVQKEQAETFHQWSEQFEIFKNNMLKFVEKSSAAIRKHDKKITTIERVVKKIADDFD